MARCTESIGHNRILAVECCETTRSGGTRCNVQRRAARARYGAGGSGWASGASVSAHCEDVAVRTVADLVNNLARARRARYGDSVGHRATLGARVARREARSDAKRSVAGLAYSHRWVY